ncbi:uncharacterized protein TNCV_1861031 [Trichonephila clavipes]|nr:uncharacterized protein TNCV_1861031 [Trichonephila clavipes]
MSERGGVDRLGLSPLHSFFTNDDLLWEGEGLHTKLSIPMLILWDHFFDDMRLIFGGSVGLPVWLGSTRTRPPPSASPPLDSILPIARDLNLSLSAFVLDTDTATRGVSFVTSFCPSSAPFAPTGPGPAVFYLSLFSLETGSPNYGRQRHFGVHQRSKNIIDADSSDENEMQLHVIRNEEHHKKEMERGEEDQIWSSINHIKSLTLLISSKYNELNGQVTLSEWTKTAPLKKSSMPNHLTHEERAGQILDGSMAMKKSPNFEN